MARVALTIAGFDPSSGAGITADLNVFAAHGFFGTACITAQTVQSTRGVFATYPNSPELVSDTLDELEADLPAAGIKIGMLATRDIVLTVASCIRRMQAHRTVPVVLDPVLVSSSGYRLLDPLAVAALRDELLPLASCVTPNRAELAALLDRPLACERQAVEDAARELQANVPGGAAVIVTGGELNPPDDFLLTRGGGVQWLPGERVATTSTHGTGCAFSSAVLTSLLGGKNLAVAARDAKAYVVGALRCAPRLGTGRGPLNHWWQEADSGA